MATYTHECIAGHNFKFGIGVINPADTTLLLQNPTLDPAADFLISINGSNTWQSLTIDPVVEPSGSEAITVEFDASETSAAVVGGADGFIRLRWHDDAGDQWIGSIVDIPVKAALTSTLTAAQVNAEADQAIVDANLATAASITSLAAAVAAINTKLGSPAGATVSADIAAIATAVDRINDTLVTSEITVVSAINGDEIELYRNDTWRFTATVTGLTLTNYEAIALVVKKHTNQRDEQAILYVRSDVGLLYLAGATATAGDGAITIDSATAFSVNIKITVTDVDPGHYTWALKVFDTTPSTDEGYTRATGRFTVKDYWLRATA